MTNQLINAIRRFGGIVELQVDNGRMTVTASKRITQRDRTKRWVTGSHLFEINHGARDPEWLDFEISEYLDLAGREVLRLQREEAKPP